MTNFVLCDEGFTEEEVVGGTGNAYGALKVGSVQECEELAYQLLASLPRSRLATIQRRLAPLLQFDVVGSLPDEISIQIFSHLPYQTLLTCSLVSRRWQALACDQTVWKNLCHMKGWAWRQPARTSPFVDHVGTRGHGQNDDSDDEGMGDSDEEPDEDDSSSSLDMTELELAKMELRSLHADMGASSRWSTRQAGPSSRAVSLRQRHSAPPELASLYASYYLIPNFKLLYQTHILLRNRFLSSSYRISALQTRGSPTNAHTNTIYCVQLYTYPSTGVQVLFTGSRDKTVREWNLKTGLVERVISGVHVSSVLSICVHNDMLASCGSDRRVAVWDLKTNRLVKLIADHDDSVLCVRFDDTRLVSCSKDRTVRTYTFPDLKPQFVLGAHRAAVNAVSISPTMIVSGSGDRSIRLWDAKTGKLLRTFENHHDRGIASIDFKPPYILSGSSDTQLRLIDISTMQGWSTAPPEGPPYGPNNPNLNPMASAGGMGAGANPPLPLPLPFATPSNSDNSSPIIGLVCQNCGSTVHQPGSGQGGPSGSSGSSNGVAGGQNGSPYRRPPINAMHTKLVRSVSLGDEYCVSGSYDLTIKIWDRKTGALVAELTGGHKGRIFCVGFDCTKVVSCGEDQTICIWDFSHGIDTSCIQL